MRGRQDASGGRGLVTVAVTSGKGGVGKTNVVVNLAVALARLRRRVAILDADFGLGNVDVLLGLAPGAHLGDVLTGDKTLSEILVEGPRGVMVIPAGSGVRQLTALEAPQCKRLAGILGELAADFDFLIIDTAAGVSDNVFEVLGLAERVVVVTSLEPAAVVDAYAMIKLLSSARPDGQIGLLVNDARDASEAELVFAQLDVAAARFLNRRLTDYGFVPHDPCVRDAVLVQRPVVDHLPQSAASRSFRVLASRLAGEDTRRARLRLLPPPGAGAPMNHPEAPRCA